MALNAKAAPEKAADPDKPATVSRVGLFGAEPRSARLAHPRRACSLSQVSQLTGWVILDAAGETDPAGVMSIELTRLGLAEVRERDLWHFTELEMLDASENHLQLADLGGLPALKQLILRVNQIEKACTEQN